MKETSIYHKVDQVLTGLIVLVSVAILASTSVEFKHEKPVAQQKKTPQAPIPDPGHVVRVDATQPETMARLSEVSLLADTILLEARGEGYAGMAAVANVIVNRMRDPRWPDDVRGVVLQPYQFSCWNNRDRADAMLAKVPKKVRDMAMRIAVEALNGKLPRMTRATHYHAVNVKPSWARSHARLGRIGRHDFYRL